MGLLLVPKLFQKKFRQELPKKLKIKKEDDFVEKNSEEFSYSIKIKHSKYFLSKKAISAGFMEKGSRFGESGMNLFLLNHSRFNTRRRVHTRSGGTSIRKRATPKKIGNPPKSLSFLRENSINSFNSKEMKKDRDSCEISEFDDSQPVARKIYEFSCMGGKKPRGISLSQIEKRQKPKIFSIRDNREINPPKRFLENSVKPLSNSGEQEVIEPALAPAPWDEGNISVNAVPKCVTLQALKNRMKTHSEQANRRMTNGSLFSNKMHIKVLKMKKKPSLNFFLRTREIKKLTDLQFKKSTEILFIFVSEQIEKAKENLFNINFDNVEEDREKICRCMISVKRCFTAAHRKIVPIINILPRREKSGFKTKLLEYTQNHKFLSFLRENLRKLAQNKKLVSRQFFLLLYTSSTVIKLSEAIFGNFKTYRLKIEKDEILSDMNVQISSKESAKFKYSTDYTSLLNCMNKNKYNWETRSGDFTDSVDEKTIRVKLSKQDNEGFSEDEEINRWTERALELNSTSRAKQKSKKWVVKRSKNKFFDSSFLMKKWAKKNNDKYSENVEYTLDGIGKNLVPSYRTKNKFREAKVYKRKGPLGQLKEN